MELDSGAVKSIVCQVLKYLMWKEIIKKFKQQSDSTKAVF